MMLTSTDADEIELSVIVLWRSLGVLIDWPRLPLIYSWVISLRHILIRIAYAEIKRYRYMLWAKEWQISCGYDTLTILQY